MGLASSKTDTTEASRTVTLQAKAPPKSSIPLQLGPRLRGPAGLAGPLLAHTSSVTLPHSGGHRVDRRCLDIHLQIFSALGADNYDNRDGIRIQVKKTRGANILRD